MIDGELPQSGYDIRFGIEMVEFSSRAPTREWEVCREARYTHCRLRYRLGRGVNVGHARVRVFGPWCRALGDRRLPRPDRRGDRRFFWIHLVPIETSLAKRKSCRRIPDRTAAKAAS